MLCAGGVRGMLASSKRLWGGSALTLALQMLARRYTEAHLEGCQECQGIHLERKGALLAMALHSVGFRPRSAWVPVATQCRWAPQLT